MQIKLMRTYSASGYAALLCLAVSGLDETELIITENELKQSKEIYILKVKGFSMNANID